MQKLTTILLLAASLALAVTAHADQPSIRTGDEKIHFTASEYMASDHAQHAKVADGGIYILVAVDARNLTHQKQFIGGMLQPNFKLRTSDIVYDVDTGAGFTFANDEHIYSGAVELPPLFHKQFLVVFTVPIELENGPWSLILPDGSERLLSIHKSR